MYMVYIYCTCVCLCVCVCAYKALNEIRLLPTLYLQCDLLSQRGLLSHYPLPHW